MGVLAQGCMLDGGTLGGETAGSADPLHHACTRDKHPSLCERGGTKSVSLYNSHGVRAVELICQVCVCVCVLV